MRLVEPTYQGDNFYDAMGVKIYPWVDFMKERNLADINKKQIEVCHIGKLLTTYFNEFSIKELRESPDFIISNGKVDIGIEHQVLVETNSKQKEGFFENICRHLEKRIESTTELRNFMLNLYFNKNLKIQNHQKEEIISTLLEVIVEKVENNILIPNPYVYDAFFMKHNRISINANFGAFVQRHLNKKSILEAIKKKENLIDKYKSNTIDNQWLVIVIGQINESSYEARTDIELDYQSKFNRVFVYEDFNNKLFELNKVNQNG